jgi:hypothetical protein
MSKSPYAASISRTLRSKECLGIGFQISGMSVFGYHFGYAADLVDNGAIQVGLVSNPDHSGEYEQARQRLCFPKLNHGYFENEIVKETVVHECVHAIFHFVRAGKRVRHKDEEFAAWLAQTIYRINKGLPTIGSSGNDPDFWRSLYLVAQQCIQGYGVEVPPAAVEFVGNYLVAGEKAHGIFYPEWQTMPPFWQHPRP